MPPKKKINLEEEAQNSNAPTKELITEDLLLEICPKEILSAFKKAKSPASRADFLYQIDNNELKALKKKAAEMDNFVTKLEAWFVQEFKDDQRGVTGKVGRVEVKEKKVAIVEDWDAFYANIKKKGEFELLNRAVNQKAVAERWEAKKQVPGVGKFVKHVISLTKVKK